MTRTEAVPAQRSPDAQSDMEQGQLNWITNFIWGIADDVLRDLYVRGKYRDAAPQWPRPQPSR